MKCNYCHAEVEQDAQFCPNCGRELSKENRCVKCGETLDSGSEFCPYCGTRQPQTSSHHSDSVPSHKDYKAKERSGVMTWQRLLGLLALLALLGFIAYGAVVYSCDSKKNQPHDPDPEQAESVDVDSVRKAVEAAEQQLQDSLMKVANALQDSIANINDSLKRANDKKNEAERRRASERPVAEMASASARRTPSASSQSAAAPSASRTVGVKNLGYATFRGTLRNGQPHDVNGRMVFKSSHVIDSRDPKGRVAEPGDYIIGEYFDGQLVQGIWYGSDNVVKGSIIIGK